MAAQKNQPILEQLEWGDYLIRQSVRGAFRNPPGFYIHLVRENVIPPEQFRNGHHRNTQNSQEEERNYWKQRELELAYEEYKRAEAVRYIAENLPEQFAKAVEQKKKELARTYRNVLPQFLEDIAAQTVRGEVAREIKVQSFDEFCRRQQA